MPIGMSESHLNLLADTMVSEAVQKYRNGNDSTAFSFLLNGFGPFNLEAFPGAGHNYHCIMDAIYRYHRYHPLHKIDSIFFYGIMREISGIKNLYSYTLCMNYIFACLDREKTGKATFHTDVPKILNVMVDVLCARELLDDYQINSRVESDNKYLKEKYGVKLW